MSDLEGLQREFNRRGSQPVRGSDLARALSAVAQMAAGVQDNRQFIDQLQDRLMIVDVLPANAPFGAVLRVRTGTLAERAALYLGNGPAQPLSKLVPTSV